MNQLYDRYQKPLFVAENGLGAIDTLREGDIIDDNYRISYLRKNILYKWKKPLQTESTYSDIQAGATMTWSWSVHQTNQISKRYGYINVDQDDMGRGTKRRIKKKTFYWYKDVIATNGEQLELFN